MYGHANQKYSGDGGGSGGRSASLERPSSSSLAVTGIVGENLCPPPSPRSTGAALRIFDTPSCQNSSSLRSSVLKSMLPIPSRRSGGHALSSSPILGLRSVLIPTTSGRRASTAQRSSLMQNSREKSA